MELAKYTTKPDSSDPNDFGFDNANEIKNHERLDDS